MTRYYSLVRRFDGGRTKFQLNYDDNIISIRIDRKLIFEKQIDFIEFILLMEYYDKYLFNTNSLNKVLLFFYTFDKIGTMRLLNKIN